MKTTVLDVATTPVTVVYDPNGTVYKHDCGAELEFSDEMPKVYSLRYSNGKPEVVVLLKDNSNQAVVEAAYQAFFKGLHAFNSTETQNYKALAKDVYAYAFYKCWSEIAALVSKGNDAEEPVRPALPEFVDTDWSPADEDEDFDWTLDMF